VLLGAALLLPLLATGADPSAAETEPGAIRPAPTHDYVHALFDLFLDRPPTAGELALSSLMVHGAESSALARGLASSDEWAGRRVDDLYVEILDRPADPGGRAHWVAAIERGLLLEDVAAHLFSSPEYRSATDGDGAWIDALYLDLLGRPSDPGGRAHWLGHLAGGTTRYSVARSFYASRESRRDRVAARFQEVLGRPPDPAGHTHWSTRLLTIGDVDLAAALASSPEFHLRATGLPVPTIRRSPVGPGTAHPLTSSWRPGCPVPPRDLVAVEFPHHRDDGSMADGVLVVHRSAAGDVVVAVRTMYGTGFPLTSARPVDHFGGDDDRSMEADNTSAFNCRTVAGTNTWSEHARGLAVDVNPRRNPWVSGSRVEPPSGSGWLDRTDVRAGMVVEGSPVLEIFRHMGWGWGGHWRTTKDYQHFSTTGR
jgi:hypothetical protein